MKGEMFFVTKGVTELQRDLFEKKRYKVNLHMHTTLSDGKKAPEEVLEIYRLAGYDAVALTDHWYYGSGGEYKGMTVLSGAEYNIGGADCRDGVYHIVGVGMTREPSVTLTMNAQQLIDAIHAAGGLAELAHPAWSLNTPEQIMALRDVDYTEIYNTVSGQHMSRRADSSLIVDQIAAQGRIYPLVADDDTHYYDGDECAAWIMVQAEDASPASLLSAIKEGSFYATQGPEIHLFREDDGYSVRCSPCSEIIFHSNYVWSPRVFTDSGITYAHYEPREKECFLRAEVVDSNGNHAWSNIIEL